MPRRAVLRHAVQVSPYEEFDSEAERVLRDAFEVCHNAGVRRLVIRAEAAQCLEAAAWVQLAPPSCRHLLCSCFAGGQAAMGETKS